MGAFIINGSLHVRLSIILRIFLTLRKKYNFKDLYKKFVKKVILQIFNILKTLTTTFLKIFFNTNLFIYSHNVL